MSNILRTKNNTALQFKIEDGKLLFKDDNCVMDDFNEAEFLYAADEETNQAIVKEIEEAFSVVISPKNNGIFDYSLNFAQ